jgi:hypothetical protein
VTPEKIKQLLLAEIEGKKSYPASNSSYCSNCLKNIEDGEIIYLAGQKICNQCVADIIEFLEV